MNSKRIFNDLEEKHKLSITKLNEFKNQFNQLFLDETSWKNISVNIANELKILSENLQDYNNALVNKNYLDELKYEVEFYKNSSLGFADGLGRKLHSIPDISTLDDDTQLFSPIEVRKLLDYVLKYIKLN